MSSASALRRSSSLGGLARTRSTSAGISSVLSNCWPLLKTANSHLVDALEVVPFGDGNSDLIEQAEPLQLRLQPRFVELANVPQKGAEAHASSAADRRNREFHRKLMSITMQGAELQALLKHNLRR